MKSFHAQGVLVVLAALTFASAALGQNRPAALPVGYTFSTVNAPGASETAAYAINNSGIIVGYITGGECSKTSDQTSCGFIDVTKKFTTVACELENATDFFDISNRAKSILTASDQVVGAVSVVGGAGGLIWEYNEGCAGVGPASSLSEAWGINASGTIVGFYLDSADDFQGFEYKNSTYTTISCPGWADTRFLGVNDAGVIVGDVSQSTGLPRQGMIYKSGKCTVFNFHKNGIKASSTTAVGINKNNEISGWYVDSKGTHGFVRLGNSFATLDYPKATITTAFHLNDAGQVAGAFAYSNGVTHGFVATPKK
jgi:hypothetical protein